MDIKVTVQLLCIHWMEYTASLHEIMHTRQESLHHKNMFMQQANYTPTTSHICNSGLGNDKQYEIKYTCRCGVKNGS